MLPLKYANHFIEQYLPTQMKVNEPVNTYIQLRRPSDMECGEPWPFQFLPVSARSRDNSIPMDLGIAIILAASS